MSDRWKKARITFKAGCWALVFFLAGCGPRIWVRDCEYLDGEFPTKVYSWTQLCDGDTSGTPCAEKCRGIKPAELEDVKARAHAQCHPGCGHWLAPGETLDYHEQIKCQEFTKDCRKRRGER